jgi:hypothetical protein
VLIRSRRQPPTPMSHLTARPFLAVRPSWANDHPDRHLARLHVPFVAVL